MNAKATTARKTTARKIGHASTLTTAQMLANIAAVTAAKAAHKAKI